MAPSCEPGVFPCRAPPARRSATIGGRLAAALTGGDDYEILFAAPPEAAGLIEELSGETGHAVTTVGEIILEPSEGRDRVTVLDEDGDSCCWQSGGGRISGSPIGR